MPISRSYFDDLKKKQVPVKLESECNAIAKARSTKTELKNQKRLMAASGKSKCTKKSKVANKSKALASTKTVRVENKVDQVQLKGKKNLKNKKKANKLNADKKK